MKLTFEVPARGQVAVVTLSRRNLLSLLHKLDMPGSARTLRSANCQQQGWVLEVRCEDDEEHYGARGFGPGEMHPETEDFLADAEGPIG